MHRRTLALRLALYTSLLLSALLCVTMNRSAFAGGGPENVLLVVNVNSWASQTIANHYAAWRQIPASNILYVNWRFADEPLPVADFRRLLIGPIMQELRQRQIDEQIDYIVYSSDFPTQIDLTADLQSANAPEQLSRIGALTGMTYLWNQTLVGNPRYVVPDANAYARERPSSTNVARTSGFRQWYGWGTDGELQEAGGSHYLLSAMLAVTHGRGNSVREALRSMNAAVRVDGTRPDGTMYFVQNSDARSRARDDRYTQAVRSLQQLGVKSSVLRGALPRQKNDVLGVMMGTRQFDWPASASGIRPGAFCDNLTDLGADFSTGTGQTPLTDFIRYGAAGASGVVAAPYDVLAEFPSPLMQAHYAKGCTLAEAYYQSVGCPYQSLLVGDPLCRPWAKIPTLTLEGAPTAAEVTGPIELVPKLSGSATNGGADRFQFFLDGHRVGYAREGDSFAMDTAALADGYHELRVVAIENSAVETQGRAILPIMTANHGRKIELKVTPSDRARWGERLTITANCPGASSIRIQRNGALLKEVSGESGVLEMDPRALGYGPVTLDAVVIGDDVTTQVTSAPVKLQIVPNNALPAQSAGDFAALAEGLQLAKNGQAVGVVNDTTTFDWLGRNGVGPLESFSLSGMFQANQADVYQFHVRFAGNLAIKIDGQTIESFAAEQPATRIVPVVLAAGTHQVEFVGTTGNEPRFDVRFGNQGVAPVGAPRFRH
ncbi:MAG: hypothetical protein SGJ19_28395 [Planctomycetia bacterium]|nr:hypothetical protein [Planctomycetia bacterium]